MIILLPLLLIVSPPQTSTTFMAVRAQVAQTCVITAARVTCRGALGRPGQHRIIRGDSITIIEF